MATTQAHSVAGGPAPERDPGRRRRTAVIAGVAVACAVAIGVPFALRAGADRPPAPAAPATQPASSSSKWTLTGDVDGDGTPDDVHLSRGGVLRIDLGSGGSLRRLLSDDPRLEGLVRVDARGLAIATSARSSRDFQGRSWAVRRVEGGHLVRLRSGGPGAIGSFAGSATAWVGTDGLLHDGRLDDLQRGADHVAVLTRTWTLADGRLGASPDGVWCWDRSGAAVPAPCATGQDWTYDVGPRGDLPDLLPARGRGEVGGAGITTSDGYTWTLHRTDPTGPAESVHEDLVVTGHGTTQRVAVPEGWAPRMSRRPVRVGDLTQGVLLSQEGGDSDTWGVYVRWAGLVQRLLTRGPVALGGGFTRSGSTAYLSWAAGDGRLYTRIGTPRPGRFHVYAWVPTSVTAGTAPVLAAQDLGVICIDETLGTYGTCTH